MTRRTSTAASARFQAPYEILIIASMIEEEAKTAEDRPKIARVIYNRLASACRCRSTPRALRDGRQASTRTTVPFGDQRNMDTPWNTYLHAGLPPTPIANPGRASIQAALNPAPNPSVGDPICAGLPDGHALRLPLLRGRRRGGQPRLRGDGRAARGQRRRGGGCRPPGLRRAHDDGRRHRLTGRPLALAGSAPGGLRRRRARLGVRRLRRRRPDPARGLDAMRTLGLVGLSVTTPHKEDVAGRRRAGACCGGVASRSTPWSVTATTARRPQHRRRRLRRRAGRGRRRRRGRARRGRGCGGGRPQPRRRARARRSRRHRGGQPHEEGGRGGRHAGAVRPSRRDRRRCTGRRRRQRHIGRLGYERRAVRSGAPASGPGRGRPRVPPARDGAVAAAARARVLGPSTGSACSSTRPSSSRSCGPAAPGPDGDAGRRPGRADAPRSAMSAARASLGRGRTPVALRRAALPHRRVSPTGRRSWSSSRGCRPAGGDGRRRPGRARPPPARLRPGSRQRFEVDELTLVGGVRHGRTLGSPVAIEIKNTEWFRSDKWHAEMSPAPGETKEPLTQVRPATPTSPACRSTASPTPATSSSGRAPARRRPVSRPARWPSCCFVSSASRCSRTWSSSARPWSTALRGRPRPTCRRSTSRRCAASIQRPPRR